MVFIPPNYQMPKEIEQPQFTPASMEGQNIDDVLGFILH